MRAAAANQDAWVGNGGGQGIARSTSGNNPHDFEPVTGLKRATGKFRGRDRLAVVLHHHAARRQFLGDKKLRQETRKLYRNRISIGNDLIHGSYFLIPISEVIGR